MIRSYAYFILALGLEKLTNVLSSAAKLTHKYEQIVWSKSYSAQGTGKGPWVDG